MNDLIYETVVTTVAADGKPHVAPMGVRYAQARRRADAVPAVDDARQHRGDRLRGAEPLTDVRVFAGCVTGRGATGRLRPPSRQRRSPACGWPARSAMSSCGWSSSSDDPQRPVLRHGARRTRRSTRRSSAFNRAQAAVLEGAVLVSRLHMLPRRQDRPPRWPICRSRSTRPPAPHEREAWGWLQRGGARTPSATARPPRRSAVVMRMLVSVRNLDEARRRGARRCRFHRPEGAGRRRARRAAGRDAAAAIVAALRSAAARRLSARPSATCRVRDRAAIVAARRRGRATCGVDYVKVGIDGGAGSARAARRAGRRGPATIVPVLHRRPRRPTAGWSTMPARSTAFRR